MQVWNTCTFHTERDYSYFFGSGKNLTFPKYQSSQHGNVMNNNKTNQDRINELKCKISYAEAARDNYREKHAMLYETNSFYVDTLKQKLTGLEARIG